MAKGNILKDKSLAFAIRIVNLYKFFVNDKKEFVLSKQILRSGTNIGANIAESETAISEKDFLSKIYIALKECSETLYWLELLKATEFLSKEQFDSIYNDCLELRRIMMATTKTLSAKLKIKS